MKQSFLLLLLCLSTYFALSQNQSIPIQRIQTVSKADLEACMDTSAFFGDTVTVRGVAVMDGGLAMAAGGRNLWLQDGYEPFSGIDIYGSVENPTSPIDLLDVKAGDSLEVLGIVDNYLGETEIRPISVKKTGHGPPIAPVPIDVGDLNDPYKINLLSSGEPLEGMYVELKQLTVLSVNYFSGGKRVSLTVEDTEGNKINIGDRFIAYRLASSGGEFVAPVPGTKICSIKGVVSHSHNGCKGNGRGYELFPFELPEICADNEVDQPISVYTDLYSHSSYKPFNSRASNAGYDLWEYIEHDCSGRYNSEFISASAEFPKASQSNFEALIKGNLRITGLSICPVENRLFDRTIQENFRVADGLSTVACISGIKGTQRFALKQESDYFLNLTGHLKYLIQEENSGHYFNGKSCEYRILRTPEALESSVLNTDQLGVFITIDGGHSLGKSLYIDKNLTDTPEYARLVTDNIKRLKGRLPLVEGFDEKLQIPILYVSINHMYWNGLAGYPRLFNEDKELLFGTPGRLNVGFTDLGKLAVQELLDNSLEDRILVDIKNVSLEARKWYYGYINQRAANGDTIPIIVSHTGISGLSWDDRVFKDKDDENKLKDEWLNHWSRNLSKEDIQAIQASKGIIGVSLDRSLLGGENFAEALRKAIPGSAQRREINIKSLVANMLKVVESTGSKEGWDLICIGSNYDGLMVPLENYASAQDFPDLERDLKEYFNNPSDIFEVYTKEEVELLMHGYSAHEIAEKVLSTNLIHFLKKHLCNRGQG